MSVQVFLLGARWNQGNHRGHRSAEPQPKTLYHPVAEPQPKPFNQRGHSVAEPQPKPFYHRGHKGTQRKTKSKTSLQRSQRREEGDRKLSWDKQTGNLRENTISKHFSLFNSGAQYPCGFCPPSCAFVASVVSSGLLSLGFGCVALRWDLGGCF
jgi:hypothetical protein